MSKEKETLFKIAKIDLVTNHAKGRVFKKLLPCFPFESATRTMLKIRTNRQWVLPFMNRRYALFYCIIKHYVNEIPKDLKKPFVDDNGGGPEHEMQETF
jgi:hypothetical protein